MRTLLLSSLFVLITMSFSMVYAAEGINPIGEAFVKAFNAGDVDGVVALYAPDAVSYPPDAMEAKGIDAIRQGYAGFFNANTVQITVTEAHHETIGDRSVAWGRYSFTMTPKAGGEPVKMEGRFLDYAKRVNGKWQYIADHASVPFTPPPPQTMETAAQ